MEPLKHTQLPPAIAPGLSVGSVCRDLWQDVRYAARALLEAANGIGIALMLTRAMSAFLFGVGPMDPIPYAAVSAVLAGMTLLATCLPAHRASRVDPVAALGAAA
jgi:hypothetical protein